MIIDFNGIEEEALMNFKGGEGELDTRNYVDGKNKIMMSRLKPGASSGLPWRKAHTRASRALSGILACISRGVAILRLSGRGSRRRSMRTA